MTKSEFLAQENVPEFIKAIVSSLPGDADVEIEGLLCKESPRHYTTGYTHSRVYRYRGRSDFRNPEGRPPLYRPLRRLPP